MDTPTKIEVNCETGETTVIPLTAEEIAALETAAAEAAAAQAAAEAEAAEKAAAKERIAQALGLTLDELKVLLS